MADQRLRGDDFLTPGMAYKKAFGSVQVPSVVVGEDANGKPIYQAGEVVVTRATPGQGLRQMEARELADDGRSTRDVAAGILGTMFGAGVANKIAGQPIVPAVRAETLTPLGASLTLHDLLRRYLGNEDLGVHDMMASRDLMPNIANPYDDDPATRSNGVFIDPGDAPRLYFPPSPPTYLDRPSDDN